MCVIMTLACPACSHPGLFRVVLACGLVAWSCCHGGKGNRTCQCDWHEVTEGDGVSR